MDRELQINIFNSIDEDRSGEIDMNELATFFANINISPIDGRPLPPAVLEQIYRGDLLNIPGFRDYFVAFDTDGNGEIDIIEFYRLFDSFHPDLKHALHELFNSVMPTPASQNIFNNGISTPARDRNHQPTRYDAPQQQQQQQIVVIGSTEIVPGITFETLHNELREYTGRELVREIGDVAARQLVQENEADACIEIHKVIKRMVHLNDAVNHLRIIAGREMDLSPFIILQMFQQNLLRGIDLYISYRYTPIYPRDGLVLLINHLLTDPNEGLQQNMMAFALNNNPQFSLSRLMFFINAYLDKLNDFGRSGEILFASYVMTYLQLGAGGYGNTVNTFIENGGLSVHPSGWITGCSGGNSDRVVIAMRYGIYKGLRRISEDQVLQSVARGPAVIARQNSARSPRGQQNTNRDELIATLIGNGMEIEEAENMAMSIMPPTPRQNSARSPRGQQNTNRDELIATLIGNGMEFDEAENMAMSIMPTTPRQNTPRQYPAAAISQRRSTAINSLIAAGYTREEAVRASAALPPTPPISRQNSIGQALPPPPPGAAFPAYIPGKRPNTRNQIILLNYLNLYRTQEGVKTFENFKNYLVERSENDNEITDEPDVFLEKMATELYAPGSAYSDEDGETFVEEYELENNNSDVWRLMPTEGGTSKIRKTRRSKKKNTKKHRNLKKKGSRKMKRKTR